MSKSKKTTKKKTETENPKETDKKEVEISDSGKWRYVGKYPTYAAGRLVYPGNVVESDKKPGPAFEPVKTS